MDLGAYVISRAQLVDEYVRRHYGEVPRMRGVRLMRFEEPIESTGPQDDMFNSHCGKDVVYIHTRCGSACWGDDDPDANYVGCGGKAWEEANPDTFIESVNDWFDGTYRDHYFRAVPGKDYDEMCAQFEEALKGDGDGAEG